MDAAVGAWTAGFDLRALNELLAEHGVPAGPVYDIAGAAADPQFQARGAIVEVDDPDVGPLAQPGVVPVLSRTPGRIAWAGARQGQHNADVYAGLLGLSARDLERLSSRRII